MNRANQAIAILAGGDSRRMGRDKAQMTFDGQTLLERAISAARSAADAVAVIGRPAPDDHTDAGADLIWLPDDEPDLGPIGGLKTALSYLERPVALIGCDMPLVDGDALEWLLDAAIQTDAQHGTASINNGRIEPLFSVYRPAAIALVDERIARKRLSLIGLVETGDFARLEPPERIAGRLININTPEQFEALRERLDEKI